MKKTLALLCLLMFAGCAAPPSYVAFVHADRTRYEAVGIQWVNYVQADPNKTVAQKLDAVALLSAWDEDLLANEKVVTPR